MRKGCTNVNSISYYENNSGSFIEQTKALDMSEIYSHFLRHIRPQGLILDAGCGAGRDICAFRSKGYEVEAFDASEKMALYASEYSGIQVRTTSFLQFNTKSNFDGIWACASLLHVKESEIEGTINHLALFLKKQGVFYLSFKLGDGERQDGERLFLDMTEVRLRKIIKKLINLKLKELWITKDVRGEERPAWLNIILYKV